MKTKTLVLNCILLLSCAASAQPWSGSSMSGITYRWGDVGIGLSNPDKQLHIANSIDAIIRLQATNGNGRKWDVLSSGGSGVVNSGHFGIVDVTNNALRFDIDMSGNVGIGTDIPERLLHLKNPGDAILRLQATNGSGKRWDILSSGGASLLNSGNFGIVDVAANVVRLSIDNSGYVHVGNPLVVGTTHANALFTVKGKIACQEAVVTLTTWSDFVFDKSYKLMPLKDVEAFYTKNHHLPEVPSAKEVIENGSDLGKMDAILLQKIEELTLYVVEQQKEIEKLKALNKHLEHSK